MTQTQCLAVFTDAGVQQRGDNFENHGLFTHIRG